MSGKVRVSIVRVKDFDQPYDAVREAVRLAGGFDEAVKSKPYVTVKPNLVRIPKFLRSGQPVPKGCITSIQVLEATIRLIKKYTSKIGFIESDTLLGTAEEAYEKYGVLALAEKYGLDLINSSKDELVRCEVPNPQFYVAMDGLEWLPSPEREVYSSEYTLRLPRKYLESVRISVPSMKTQVDPYSAITFSVKNMFGVLPEAKKYIKFHEKIQWGDKKYDTGINVGRAILDLCQVAPPDYAIIDGLWGLHGPGSPGTGYSVKIGVIIASRDPWAADTVAGEVVGFDMRRLHYFRKAGLMGLGVTDMDGIEVVGESVDSVKVPFKVDVSLESQQLLNEACAR
ncbi:MAG: DUF362 domain-containing protein [Candidatus Bathyarchaeia archaeon]